MCKVTSVKCGAFGIVLMVVVLDQLSKIWVLNTYTPYLPVHQTTFFNITLIFNTGAAFGIFSSQESWYTWFLVVFTACVSLYLLYRLFKLEPQQWLLGGALSLILGGALSNLYDRLTLGQVVDFIDLFYHSHHWPVFNLADGAICIGAGLLFFCFESSQPHA